MFLNELMLSMIPVSIFMLFCFVPALLIFYMFRYQIRKKKSPLNIELLRSPGEALRNQIDKSTSDILEYFMYLVLWPILFYTVTITQYSFLNRKPGITYFILMGLFLFGVIFFLMKKLYKIIHVTGPT